MFNLSLTEILLIILAIEFFFVVIVIINQQNKIKEIRKDVNFMMVRTERYEKEMFKYDKRTSCLENSMLRQEIRSADKKKKN